MDLVEQLAVGSSQLHLQRHAAGLVGGAAQAGVVGADAVLDPVEQPLVELVAGEEALGQLLDGAVHRQVVLAGGDDQVDLFQDAVVVDLVVMEQGAAGRLADADAEVLVDSGAAADVMVDEDFVSENLLDPLQAVEDFDQPGVVVVETGAHRLAIDFSLAAGKPLVAQGERGLSRKSAEAGNASYYYSLTRLPTRGTLRLGKEEFQLVGNSWLDREWSTSALASDQTGWDWFALQLDDGNELMYYQLRRKDGSTDPASAGVWVLPDGSSSDLAQEDLQLEPTDRWTSPRGGSYPAGWRLQIEEEQLDLRIEPLLADQELDATIRYWEGAVRVRGSRAGKQVSGYGYVELTGYAQEVGR